MKDETFIFLGENYVGNAYRQTSSPVKQYCKISEIISFITDSINNNTLKKGCKYTENDYIKFKYKFIKGNNKTSVSVLINLKDSLLYIKEIETLDNYLINRGSINNFDVKLMIILLDKPIVLLTFTNTVLARKPTNSGVIK